jgi:hypothetical protein
LLGTAQFAPRRSRWRGGDVFVDVIVGLLLVLLAGLALSVRVLKQYERAVMFRLGRVTGDARGRGRSCSSRSSSGCTASRCGSSRCRSSRRGIINP